MESEPEVGERRSEGAGNVALNLTLWQLRVMRKRLLAWGESNRQDFPWRRRLDPYAVLVAEFMLHRTQARQVRPIFDTFMRAFPDLKSFSAGDPKERTGILRPLGLEWRTSAMTAALLQLWGAFGAVPADYSALMGIRGIGQYIAGATVCFATNRPVVLVDGNTVRVTGRVLGLDLRGEARRRRAMINAIRVVCDPNEPRNFYWAMIDLAHKVCRPRNPNCSACPLRDIPCRYAPTVEG